MTRKPIASRSCAIEMLEARALRSGTPSLPGVSSPTPVASTFTSAAPTAALVGKAYSYTITTDDANGDPRTLTAPTLPTWLTFTDNTDGTATLTGTPTSADIGSAPVQLTVNDGTFTTNQDFTLVTAAPDSAVLTAGNLVVHGTDNDEDIHVWSPKGRADTLRVAVDMKVWNFTLANVSGVEIYGEAGNDTILANTAMGVYAYGGDGNDQITGGDGNDTLAGGQGNDYIQGMNGDDLLSGHGGDDVIDGGYGNDRLYGNAGRDRLYGNLGRDQYDGGAGRDVFLSKDDTYDTLVGDSNDGDIAVADDADTITGITDLR